MEEKFSFDHFSSFTADGKTRDIGELKDFLADKDIHGITISKKLNIGDKVKLKGRDYITIVKYIDYEMPGIGVVDYAGVRESGNDENLLSVFNQSEIESIVYDQDNEVNKEERKWKR